MTERCSTSCSIFVKDVRHGNFSDANVVLKLYVFGQVQSTEVKESRTAFVSFNSEFHFTTKQTDEEVLGTVIGCRFEKTNAFFANTLIGRGGIQLSNILRSPGCMKDNIEVQLMHANDTEPQGVLFLKITVLREGYKGSLQRQVRRTAPTIDTRTLEAAVVTRRVKDDEDNASDNNSNRSSMSANLFVSIFELKNVLDPATYSNDNEVRLIIKCGEHICKSEFYPLDVKDTIDINDTYRFPLFQTAEYSHVGILVQTKDKTTVGSLFFSILSLAVEEVPYHVEHFYGQCRTLSRKPTEEPTEYIGSICVSASVSPCSKRELLPPSRERCTSVKMPGVKTVDSFLDVYRIYVNDEIKSGWKLRFSFENKCSERFIYGKDLTAAEGQFSLKGQMVSDLVNCPFYTVEIINDERYVLGVAKISYKAVSSTSGYPQWLTLDRGEKTVKTSPITILCTLNMKERKDSTKKSLAAQRYNLSFVPYVYRIEVYSGSDLVSPGNSVHPNSVSVLASLGGEVKQSQGIKGTKYPVWLWASQMICEVPVLSFAGVILGPPLDVYCIDERSNGVKLLIGEVKISTNRELSKFTSKGQQNSYMEPSWYTIKRKNTEYAGRLLVNLSIIKSSEVAILRPLSIECRRLKVIVNLLSLRDIPKELQSPAMKVSLANYHGVPSDSNYFSILNLSGSEKWSVSEAWQYDIFEKIILDVDLPLRSKFDPILNIQLFSNNKLVGETSYYMLEIMPWIRYNLCRDKLEKHRKHAKETKIESKAMHVLDVIKEGRDEVEYEVEEKRFGAKDEQRINQNSLYSNFMFHYDEILRAGYRHHRISESVPDMYLTNFIYRAGQEDQLSNRARKAFESTRIIDGTTEFKDCIPYLELPLRRDDSKEQQLGHLRAIIGSSYSDQQIILTSLEDPLKRLENRLWGGANKSVPKPSTLFKTPSESLDPIFVKASLRDRIPPQLIYRFYIFKLYNLPGIANRDNENNSTSALPKLFACVGSRSQEVRIDLEDRLEGTNVYEIMKVVELDGSLPSGIRACFVLKLGDDQGYCYVDLEERFASKTWEKSVQLASDRENQFFSKKDGDSTFGSIEYRVEVMDIANVTKALPLQKESLKPIELRVVVWGCRNLYSKYTSCMDVRVATRIENANYTASPSLQFTDIHYGSVGTALFNWRMVYKEVDSRKLTNLNLSVFHKNTILTETGMLIGDADLDISEYLKQCSRKRNTLVYNVELPINMKDKLAGYVQLTISLLPQDMAVIEPVGMKRDEPNVNPILQTPTEGRKWRDFMANPDSKNQTRAITKKHYIILAIAFVWMIFTGVVWPGLYVNAGIR